MGGWKKMRFHGWSSLVIVVFLIFAWVPQIYEQQQEAKQERKREELIATNLADSYFQVTRVAVGDVVRGEDAILAVDRITHRKFKGTYRVSIRTFPAYTIICTATDTIDYKVGAVLPDPLTLSWWAHDGECSAASLDIGTYILLTSWEIHLEELGIPNQYVEAESNPFNVLTVTPQQAQRAIEQLQVLEKKVDNLTEVD